MDASWGQQAVWPAVLIHAKPPDPHKRLTAIQPAARGRAFNHIFTPFSVKYFTAPGCHGIGELVLIWFSTEKLFAS